MANFIIKDFQADKMVKLKVKGLTTLRGVSSSGKSSVLKAIQAATTNRFTAQQVRIGQPYALVRIMWEDGGEVMDVKRRAEGGSPIIDFKNVTYNKLNRNVPSEIVEFHNLGILEVGSDLFYLNFVNQFQPPLLIKFSHKRVMEILAASEGINEYNLVNKKMAENRLVNRGRFAEVDALLTNNKEKLSIYDAIYAQKAEAYQKASDSFAAYNGYQDENEQIESLQASYGEEHDLERALYFAKEQFKALEAVEKGIEELEAAKVVDNTCQAIKEDMRKVISWRKEEKKIKALSLQLENLSVKFDVVETHKREQEQVDQILNAYRLHDESETKLEDVKALLQSLKKVEESLDGVGHLKQVEAQLTQLSSTYKTCVEQETRMKEINYVLENNLCPVCGNKLEENMDKKECQEARNRLIAEQATLTEKIKQTKTTIQEKSKSLGIEPTIEALDKKQQEVKESLAKATEELEKNVQAYESLVQEQNAEQSNA